MGNVRYNYECASGCGEVRTARTDKGPQFWNICTRCKQHRPFVKRSRTVYYR